MLYHIPLIGESVRNVANELTELNPATPWSQIIGMRNILIHNYFGVDLDEVWNVVEKDIPRLRHTVSELIQQLQDP